MADTTNTNTSSSAPPDSAQDDQPPVDTSTMTSLYKEVSLSDLQPTVGELEQTAADLKEQRAQLDKDYEADRAQAAAAEQQAVASKREVADKTIQFATEEKTEEDKALQQWVDNTPSRQAYYSTAMHAAPFLAIMTALGGKVSRLNGQQMIAAQTGIVQGLNESSEEKFNAAMEQWKAGYQQMKDHIATLERYHSMMLTAYGNRSDADQLAAAAAIRMAGDTRAAKDKNLDQSISAYHWLLQARLGLGKVNIATEKLNDKRKQDAAPLPPGWTQETVDYYTRREIAGDHSWKMGRGMDKKGVAAIMANVAKVSKMWGISPEEAATIGDKRKAWSSALVKQEGFAASADQFVKNFQEQADIVEKYIEPGVGGAINPVLNRWIQAGRVAIKGDGEVTALDTAITGLTREHARIVNGIRSNAQLLDSATKTADRLANKDMTADMIEADIGVMREEAHNAKSTLHWEVNNLEQQMSQFGVAGKMAEKEAAAKKAAGTPAAAPTTPAAAAPRAAAAAAPGKQIVSSGYSPSRGKWIIVYADGTHGESATNPKLNTLH